MTAAQIIGTAISVLEEAIATDDNYWEQYGQGQNAEEAEASGYLVGYRDALSAVHTLVAHSDASTLAGYLGSITDLMIEKRQDRLEYLRGELRAERISYGELAELQSLAEYIEPGDLELLEAAGVPEADAT
jgi:hypothetical protein